MDGGQKPRVVVLPFPALGHSIPFLDLARRLASRPLTVIYVTTPANVSRAQQLIPQDLDIVLVVLPTPIVEGLPQGHESADLLPRRSMPLIFEFMEKLKDPFNNWMERQLQHNQRTAPPVCIIHDMLIGWVHETAEKFRISSLEFFTFGAFATNVIYCISRSILQHNALERDGDSIVLNMNLPLPLRLHRHEVAGDFLDPDLSTIMLFFLRRIHSIGKGRGILINTFHELEAAYVQQLKKLTGKPVWAIGPVLPPNFYDGVARSSGRGKMTDISDEELLQWLDSQHPRSVVYISFGSLATLSQHQTDALARGLEASEQPFVWAIRVPPGIESPTLDSTGPDCRYLPEGFQDRTKGRGLIIWGWAPQLVILSHSCVGAFMSHCGWNSTVESISLGVPIIAWPMRGDQHFNSRLAVDLGVGIQMCQHPDGVPEPWRVEEIVRLVQNGKEGKDMRTRAEKLKAMGRTAVEEGGSSEADLQAFVDDMQTIR